MGKMKLYTGKEIEFHGCPGCLYARHEFTLPCGFVYEDDLFTISQDWELPIPGFFVLSPKRCVEKLSDLTDKEREKMFLLLYTTMNVLRNANICERFNVIFEEKENRHFHIWIMPREEWMMDFGNIMENIEKIFSYAKTNFRTEETFKKIEEITNIVKNKFEI